MSRPIQVLSDEIARQIAAGEVVERPASVVKELCENALDAGATMITVETREGGKSYIRVSDNGSGIAREDIPLAFLRHATSKIRSADDLLSISTMGFRGEALYSIAAVSKVTLVTKRPEDETGSRVTNEGGTLGEITDAGCPDGTTFAAEDLFYNTPARLKFMKSQQAETAAVNTVMMGIVLSHPEVSIQWIHNGKTLMHSAGDGSLRNAVYALYGREVARCCIPVDLEKNGVRLTGLLGQPEIVRNNRNQEHLFVNGRMIQSPLLARAVERGYGTLLMVQKYPFFVLDLKIDPEAVDVNVHPNKLQVRFRDEQSLFGTVMSLVSAALRDYTRSPREFRLEEQEKPAGKTGNLLDRWQIPAVPTQSPLTEQPRRPETARPEPAAAPDDAVPSPKKTAPVPTVASMLAEYRRQTLEGKPVQTSDFHSMFAEEPPKHTAPVPEPAQQEMEKPPEDYRVDGTAFSTYLILEHGNRLYLIDQHAAHERLLFDRFMDEYSRSAVVSQPLLVPCLLDLNTEDRLTLEEQGDALIRMGFDYEEYGPGAWRVTAVPQILGQSQPAELLRELLGILRQPEYANRKTPVEEQLLYAACRKAIKGGDSLTEREIEALLEIFRKEDTPLNCPHGRPVCMILTKDQIEKQFKRIV